MMKKILFSLAVLIGISASAQVKIGDNPTTIGSGSLLELESTNKALLLTRVANTAAVDSPVNGMLIYDLEGKCLKGFNEGSWVALSPCDPANMNLAVANPTYQGVSVIDPQGVGYNGENVNVGSTITVELTNNQPGNYALVAEHTNTGLKYTASGYLATVGTHTVVLRNNGVHIPWNVYGTLTMELTGANNTINIEPRIDIKSIPASATAVVDVTYGSQTWMDRNLGARRVATALDDVLSYGNHYQWGRPADGHEISVWNGADPTSGRGFANATALEALATSDDPGHSNFILTEVTPVDWRNDNNNNRWATANQGPCPAGYHVPTDAQWLSADTFAHTSNGDNGWDNNQEIFDSPLKLPTAGYRLRTTGLLSDLGTVGRCWASTPFDTNARIMRFSSTSANRVTTGRAHGLSVRCIKLPATASATFTTTNPTYNGTSVINATGVGYNGEEVPAASTIVVEATVSELGTDNSYNISATDTATGLVYSATGTFTTTGNQNITLTHNTVSIPATTYGVLNMTVSGTPFTNTKDIAPRIDIKSIPASATEVVDVTYGGQTWMDRNLGARRVATALNDVLSYGNHYQWGRAADGHEISVWNGATLTSGRGFANATALEALATSDDPGHSNFILTDVSPYDWRDDNNDNRWATANQGPCPAGYHVPTDTQWTSADTFGAWDNNTDAFNSDLKLPSAGYRNRSNGLLNVQGTNGYYWSSTVLGTIARRLTFSSTVAGTGHTDRAYGFCVRCLKDN